MWGINCSYGKYITVDYYLYLEQASVHLVKAHGYQHSQTSLNERVWLAGIEH